MHACFIFFTTWTSEPWSLHLHLRVRLSSSTSANPGNSEDDACLAKSSCLADVQRTFVRCRLKENVDKRELIVKTSRKKQQRNDRDPFTVAWNQTASRSSVRYLGVTLGSTLSMEAHIETIRRRAYYHLLSNRRARGFLDQPSARLLVKSNVISRLDYWNSLLSGLTVSSLQRQKVFSSRPGLNLSFIICSRNFQHFDVMKGK